MMKVILIILYISLLYSQVKSTCYLTLFKADCGEPLDENPVADGKTSTFSCPLSWFFTIKERRNLRMRSLKEMLPANLIDLFATRRRVGDTEGEWYEIGQWYGTCTGLGDKDPAGGQLCQLWYTFEADEIKEYLSGTMLFRGEDITPVTINGGTGYIWLAVNGGFNMTYDRGAYTQDGILCY